MKNLKIIISLQTRCSPWLVGQESDQKESYYQLLRATWLEFKLDPDTYQVNVL